MFDGIWLIKAYCDFHYICNHWCCNLVNGIETKKFIKKVSFLKDYSVFFSVKQEFSSGIAPNFYII